MRIAVLGCGNMGRAIIAGLLKAYDDVSIIAYDKSEAALKFLPDEALVVPLDEWDLDENRPDAVVIAVKPQDMAEALALFSGLAQRDDTPLFMSIAAGIGIARLEKLLPQHARICRVMPNTPALVGEAMSAYCLNSRCRDSDKSIVERVLGSFGRVVRVPEKQLNAITGLSGSGPAYVYLFIEALIEGGVAAGIPYAVARECAVQTVVGAARMVQQGDESPAALKAAVMSPGGTTVRGLMELEKNKFKFSVIKAVIEAAVRAEELGRQE
ncbi:MAG TPA: pyrroline-5-carboxylate reductase [Chitinivibrionales bacterium]|jgi:pyrroline-5-carboxylate reductase|nr:pyrroline-5-carboxylate reductase [Chitinivibrionales bacterium]